LAPDSIRLFDDQDFKENEQAISPVTIKQAGNWHELPGEPVVGDEKENAASSLRWNLPEGVIVLLSAKDDGTNNIVLFGKGQYTDLAACDFNNYASRWTWAYIGQPKTADNR
jgi:hypothetical protein